MAKVYRRPKHDRESITAEEIRERMSYDPESGEFLRDGQKCVRIDKNYGYGLIHYHGYSYKAHRLAWLHFYGRWPVKFLDHINHDRADNRISNLREATYQQNAVHRRGYSKHGVKGVSYQPKYIHRPWVAVCRADGKRLYIGAFSTKEAAAAAYLRAASAAHGEFATAQTIKPIGIAWPTPDQAKREAELDAAKVAA